MDRRRFLGLFSAGVAGIALDQAIPFNRVWSFPKKIVRGDIFSIASLNALNYEEEFAKPFKIGTTIRVRLPQRFIVRDYIGDFSQPEKHCDLTLIDAEMVREVSEYITPAFPPELRP